MAVLGVPSRRDACFCMAPRWPQDGPKMAPKDQKRTIWSAILGPDTDRSAVGKQCKSIFRRTWALGGHARDESI